MADRIGDNAERGRRDHHRHDRQPVQPVGQVDRVREQHDHQRREDDEAVAERDEHVLQEGHRHLARKGRRVPFHDDPRRRDGAGELHHQLRLARNAVGFLLRHLQIVVIEAEQAEQRRHAQHDPHIDVRQIGPQQGRREGRDEDQQPAHRGRALLADHMGVAHEIADRLALALLHLQPVDQRPPEDQPDQQRRHDRPACAERQIAEQVEEPEVAGEGFEQKIQHDAFLFRRIRDGARLECVDYGGHAAAERTFHHDDVAGPDVGRDES